MVETDSELADYLQEEMSAVKAERDRAIANERNAQIAIGLLRELVGSLWIVVSAAQDAKAIDGRLPDQTFSETLEFYEKRMDEVNERLL